MNDLNLEEVLNDAIDNKLEYYDLNHINLEENQLKQLLIAIQNNPNIRFIIYNQESLNREYLLQIDEKIRKFISFHEIHFNAIAANYERLKNYYDFKRPPDQQYCTEYIFEIASKENFSTLERIQLQLEMNNIFSESRYNPNLRHYYMCCIMALSSFKITNNLAVKLKNSNWSKMDLILENNISNNIVLSACIYRNEVGNRIVISFPFLNDDDDDDDSKKCAAFHNISKRVLNVLNVIRNIDIVVNSNSITFVGYSFAAWYAELSVYLCAKLKYFNNKRIISKDQDKIILDPPKIEAITFESPGSFDFLELINNNQRNLKPVNLRSLKIISFFCDPNFLNTLYNHIGEKYFISTKKEETRIIIKEYLRKEESKLKDMEKKLDNEKTKKLVTFFFQGNF
jgi:hypothetical protein